MTLEALKAAERRTVGVKQTEKAVQKADAIAVFIAKDADDRVTEKLRELCESNGVEIVRIETMYEIGRACGIHVRAAAAGILKF